MRRRHVSYSNCPELSRQLTRYYCLGVPKQRRISTNSRILACITSTANKQARRYAAIVSPLPRKFESDFLGSLSEYILQISYH